MASFPIRPLFGFLVAATTALITASPPLHAQQAMAVGVDPVVSEATHQTFPVLGRFVARQAGVVAARINGPIGSFNVEVGDRVKAGDVLAVLIKNSLQTVRDLRAADVTQYQAARNTANETLKLRLQELRRLESLRKSAAFSQARLEDKHQEAAVARAEIAEADGQLKSAEASLHLAEINLFNADITAPYDGVVVRRHTETGAFVNVGDPVVSLVNDSNLEIEADVPARNIDGLTPGTLVHAQHAGGGNIETEVRAVIPDENPQTRTQTVRFIIKEKPAESVSRTGKDRRIATNQSVTLLIPATGAASALTVHKDAVLNRHGKTIVFLHKDGKAIIRPVVLSLSVGSRLIVESGLAEGDLVVVRGNERLRPNQSITFSLPDAKASTDAAPKG